MSPVGASIAKSMKMSFSLSSLQPSSNSLEGPEHARLRADRPYNSLTKKRKDPEQEQWRRSWGSREDNKDDFWAAIQSNYNYIMDTNLIDSCKEANGELAWDETDVSTLSWGLKELSGQFSELYSWLGAIQELVYSKEENLLDKSLRAAHMEELRRKAYRRRLFNEQAGKLVSRAPTLRDEVAWRVDHLNTKWELVEQIMTPGVQPVSNQQDVSADFDHEVKCLRKWLREMESRLQPLSFHVDWSRAELEEKAMEHMTLVTCRCSSDSDEEPVTKQPRLSRRQSRESGSSSSQSGKSAQSSRSSLRSGRSGRSRRSRTQKLQTNRSDHSDSDVSSENRFNDDGSYFEDEIYVLCVMDTNDPEVSNNTECEGVPGSTVVLGDQGEEGDVEESGASEEERDDMPPTPGVATPIDEVDSPREPSCRDNKKDVIKRRRPLEESASFSTSDRKSKNCATFYFKHHDTDSEADSRPGNESPNMVESSEEEWTYTASSPKDSVLSIDERRTNVVVRLDFGEGATVERSHVVRTCDEINGNGPVVNGNESKLKIASANGKGLGNPQESIQCVKKSKNDDDENEETDEEDDDDENKNKEIRGDETSIQRLILEVEKLVRESTESNPSKRLPPLIFEDLGIVNNNRAKYARIKEWLKLNSIRNREGDYTSQYWLQPLDSCDASGEYTTGESDAEKQSVSSDDLQSSVATFRRLDGSFGCVSQSISQEVIDDPDRTPVNDGHYPGIESSTPKVVMRSKRKSNGPRPWSVSCISQIGNSSTLDEANDPISQFSISETALHQLVAIPPTKSVSLDATGSCIPFNNSSSTLLEETAISQDGTVVRNSSLRRKKGKLRKKTVGRKSESGSDGVNANHHSAGSDGCSKEQRSPRRNTSNRPIRTISRDCQGRLTTLVKSGSFSGCTARQQLSIERNIVSDPTAPFKVQPCCQWDPSTSETEDEERSRGCVGYEDNLLDTVLNSKDLNSQFNMDSDIEKNSLGNNSFSEQAWDNYQEKYMSEPYSEAPDVDAARRLLDFGDDYRNFLDSQSDCASSMSAVRENSPRMSRKRMHHGVGVDSTEDSDSDMEDLRKLMEKSQSQLEMSENLSLRVNGILTSGDCTELQCTCKENIRCLQAVLEAVGGALRGEKNAKQIRGLIERWEFLSNRAEETCRASVLQRDMAGMRLEFRQIQERLLSYEIVLDQQHVLDERINQVTNELARISEGKNALLALNVSTHRLITDAGTSALPGFQVLKDEVADLYRLWDETSQKANQQLSALQAVQQFAARLNELQSALRRDKDTLAVLDAALQAGATSEVASSMRDVARLLSEKQDICCQNGNTVTSVKDKEKDKDSENCQDGSSSMVIGSSLAQEGGGSLSDSGISDSGSEQELSERERRLATLRRLARTLETQLAPGSAALAELAKRIEGAECELRGLQKQCRELIVRTAASVEARGVGRARSQATAMVSKRKKTTSADMEVDTLLDSLSNSSASTTTDGGDPDNEPGRPSGWIWRVLRAALPFQLALVALFCAACLLEPHCCEAANTLNLSLTPQLRYVRGPPPV
ncbi:uncharacterized protein LOC107265729 isoform X2 [Cephus cinctus]|uniref:Uncharacterized protein LOC107265729 isoform X2 n=1 Tax=Cephus cinctus TaxID=211228 RepID=A0AAJ7RDC0_CEPCN|nr:uncharacterized protein LOC107265729 isoform X2 [Cephus cinctus]